MDYETSFEVVSGLEVFKKYPLKDENAKKSMASFVFKYGITDMYLLNKVAEGLLAAASIQVANLPTDITPHELLDAELLTKKISPQVERIRQEFFGKSEAPFSNWEEAKNWLEEQSVSELGLVKFMRSFGTGEIIVRRIEGMSFLEKPASIVVPLFEETLALAQRLAVNHPSLLMHTLADTSLVYRKYTIYYTTHEKDLSSGEESAHTLGINFRGRLTLSDMRRIYQEVAVKFFGGRKVKQVTAKHLKLYRMVDGKGGPKARRVVAFWREIMSEWNQKYPGDTYKTWKGVKIAYERLMDRLEKRPVLNGDTTKTLVALSAKKGEKP